VAVLLRRVLQALRALWASFAPFARVVPFARLTPFVRRARFALLVGAGLAGCAAPTSVVLLPAADGHASALSVEHRGETVVLDQPYAAVREGAFGARAYQADPKDVQAQFGPALAAQPARPARYTLYFIEGKDTLTDESRQLVETSLAEIAKRPVPDVVVVGHTDLVGSHASNDVLSKQRPDLIPNELVRIGVDARKIQVIARGKREPTVPTADGVAEPRNRRVEVVVR